MQQFPLNNVSYFPEARTDVAARPHANRIKKQVWEERLIRRIDHTDCLSVIDVDKLLLFWIKCTTTHECLRRIRFGEFSGISIGRGRKKQAREGLELVHFDGVRQ